MKTKTSLDKLFQQAQKSTFHADNKTKNVIFSAAHEKQNEESKTTSAFNLFSQYFLRVSFGVFLLAISSYLIHGIWKDSRPSFQVGSNYLVNIDIQQLKKSDVAFIEIIPSDQIQFVSKSFLGISENRSLKISGSVLEKRSTLPIAINAQKTGNAKLKINFYDRDLNILSEELIEMSIKDG